MPVYAIDFFQTMMRVLKTLVLSHPAITSSLKPNNRTPDSNMSIYENALNLRTLPDFVKKFIRLAG